mgnify:CR=1 FL=1
MKAEYERDANFKYLVLRGFREKKRILVEDVGKWACDHEGGTSRCGRCMDCGLELDKFGRAK